MNTGTELSLSKMSENTVKKIADVEALCAYTYSGDLPHLVTICVCFLFFCSSVFDLNSVTCFCIFLFACFCFSFVGLIDFSHLHVNYCFVDAFFLREGWKTVRVRTENYWHYPQCYQNHFVLGKHHVKGTKYNPTRHVVHKFKKY